MPCWRYGAKACRLSREVQKEAGMAEHWAEIVIRRLKQYLNEESCKDVKSDKQNIKVQDSTKEFFKF